MLNTDSHAEVSEIEEIAVSGEGEEDTAPDGKSKKGLVIGIVAILLVIAAVAAAVFLFIGSSYGARNDLIFFNAVDGGVNKTFIAYKDGSKGEIEAVMRDTKLSLDGTKGAVMTNWDSGASNGVLYYVNGKDKPRHISDGVYSYTLSDSGNAVVYFTDFESADGAAVLKLYKSGKDYTIDESAYYDSPPVISPDGNNVFYVKKVSAENGGGLTAAVSTNGSAGKELADVGNVTPVAVADGAKYLYYVNRGLLTVQKGIGGEAKEISVGSVGDVYFNRNYSQVVFNETSSESPDGWRTYISVNGGNSKKVYDSQTLDFIIPQNGQSSVTPAATVYGFMGFKNKAFRSVYGIFVLNNNLQSERMTSQLVNTAVMNKSGKRLFFLEGQVLKSGRVSDPGGKKVQIADDAKAFVPASGANVYYLNQNNELYRRNVKKMQSNPEGTWVAEFVKDDTLAISSKGTVFYLNQDNDVCSVKGVKRKKIKSNVAKLTLVNNNVFYYLDAGEGYYDVYNSTGGSNFNRLLFDVQLPNEQTLTSSSGGGYDNSSDNSGDNSYYGDDYNYEEDFDDWGGDADDWDDDADWGD